MFTDEKSPVRISHQESLQKCSGMEENMKFHFKDKEQPIFIEGPKTLHQRVLEDLEKTQYDLDTAYRGFDYVTDPDLIDCYIYDINAILKRYKYLLEQASAYNESSETNYHVSDAETAITVLS